MIGSKLHQGRFRLDMRKHYSSLPVSEGGLQEGWRGTFYKGV